MELILFRHGKAEEENPGGDAARDLVEKGESQARKAGRLLRVMDRVPDLVLTSPRLRARRTAEIFCELTGLPGPVAEQWLDCGMTPETAVERLANVRDFKRVMIVGHEPDFSALAARILGCGPESIEVKKGALIGIKWKPTGEAPGTLVYAIPPGLMG